ncbi:MAG: metal-sensitive transcriptional regulator [bacterium]|jgi:DNA-binding FrmR family transcriptional regulator
MEGQHRHVSLSHYERDKDGILERLRKVEGQVRGIQKMVDEDRYCVDILTQVAAVRAALNKVGLMLLESHTRGCVVQAIQENHGEGAIKELMAVVQKFIK